MRSAAVLRRRRRQGGPIAALRSELGDAAIAGLYVMGSGQTSTGGVLDSWADARGAGFGPTLSAAGSARPAVDADGIVTFDGVDDYLRAEGGLAAITADHALLYVGTLPTAAGAALISISATETLGTRLDDSAVSTIRMLGSTGGAATMASPAGVRVAHGRFDATPVTVGIRVGSGAETTGGATALTAGLNRLTVGATQLTAPSGFAAMICRAVILYNGDYGSGTQYESVNRFGASLGATI